MRPDTRNRLIAATLVGLAILLLPGLLLHGQGRDSRPATVENQTSDTIILTYQESDGAYSSKNQVQLYPGERKRLNVSRIQGEVCAWGAKEYEPAEKIGCRTLRPGEYWVIHS